MSKDWTQVLLLVWQGRCWLSHLSIPQFSYCIFLGTGGCSCEHISLSHTKMTTFRSTLLSILSCSWFLQWWSFKFWWELLLLASAPTNLSVKFWPTTSFFCLGYSIIWDYQAAFLLKLYHFNINLKIDWWVLVMLLLLGLTFIKILMYLGKFSN